MRPSGISESAAFMPTSRGRRCVPPDPGTTPRITSGRPSCAFGAGNPPAAGKRQFQPAAKTGPPDCGDDRHRGRLECRHHHWQVGLGHRQVEFTGIGTGGEDLTGPGENDPFHPGIIGNGRQRRDQTGADVVIDGVDRRPVDLDNRRQPDPVMPDMVRMCRHDIP